MPDQKLDNLLNLALDATEEEREKSRNLNVGYEKQTRKWEIIVKHSEALPGGSEISVVSLLGGYAIVTLPESMLDEYSRRPQIEFIEKPTRLYFEDFFSKEASCITQVQRNEPGNLQLTGRGVLIGIVDSGVDYRHLAFLTADGKSRILRLWDQGIPGNPPEGYATAVVTLPESEISAYSVREQIEFIEKPKRLYFETFEEREASCILPVQNGADGLTGEGILVGIVDSGVDYFHPDFRNEDGSTRILRLWDQSVDGNPPENYVSGTEYTKEEIDEALALGETEGRRLVPSGDFSGHGTAVLGIAAGNGRASEGVNRGVAYEK